MINNQKGQTSLEALMAFPLLVLFIFMALILFTSARSLIWAQYQLHEAIVCLQDQSRTTCTKNFKEKMKQHLTYWKLEDVKLKNEIHFDTGQMIISFNLLKKFTLNIEKRVLRE